MDEKRAIEITRAVVSYGMVECGAVRRPEDVSRYSLAEMVIAAELVRTLNAKGRPGGLCHWVPEDRFIAAVYAAIHYEPESTQQMPLKGIINVPGRILLCVTTESDGG